MQLETSIEYVKKYVSGPNDFDHLHVTILAKNSMGVRVVRSSVCRENVFVEQFAVDMTGFKNGRVLSTTAGVSSVEDLKARFEKLAVDIDKQSIDKELVLPVLDPGQHTFNLAPNSMELSFSPEILYPTIEKAVAPVRDDKLRVTGYVEAKETQEYCFASGGFEAVVHDHGLTVTMTVDEPGTQISGAAVGAVPGAHARGLETVVGRSVSEAAQLCKDSAQPVEIDPGDYTVILSPKATRDIVGTAIMYRMFDRRKVDEGRTWLSNNKDTLEMPAGLMLSQRANIQTEHGDYTDPGINHRNIFCPDMHLVNKGRVQDLHTEPFWAKEKGVRETFGPYYAPPLVMEGNDLEKAQDLKEMIAATERGIFVADTWYLRMVAEMEGIITGMTRDGLFLIENGKITKPLINMRWHENPFRVLGAIDMMTKEKRVMGLSRFAGDSRGGLACFPYVRVNDFHFSSVTKF